MIFWLLIAVSAASALAYGAFFLRGPETLARGAIKGAFMGALALAFAPTQPLFAAALAAAAAGDALLAFEKQSWTLPLAMAAFLTMQAIYIAIFTAHQAGAASPLRIALAAGTLAIVAAFLVWFWSDWRERRIDPLRIAAMIYGGVLVAMALAAYGLPWTAWPAMAGAVLFLISDGVLSAELFRLPPDAPARRITAPLVWWTYAGGQALIVWGVSRLAL